MDDTQKVQNTGQTVASDTSQGNTVFQFVKPIQTPLENTTAKQSEPEQTPDVTAEEQAQIQGGKEAEPLPSLDTTKWVEASEPQEVELPPEVQQVGVTPVNDSLELDQEAEDAGLSYSAPVVPVMAAQEPSRIKLPMTEEEAKKVMAHPNPSSSRYWLAMNMLRQLGWLKHNNIEKKV